jgi:hypothetical protein
MDLDKKFISEIIKFWGFMADIDPKIIFFGMHIKFPKIIRLPKKIIYFDEYLRKKVQKTVFTFFDHIYGIQFFYFFSLKFKLF